VVDRDVVSLLKSRSRDGVEACFSDFSILNNTGRSWSQSQLENQTSQSRLDLEAQGLILQMIFSNCL